MFLIVIIRIIMIIRMTILILVIISIITVKHNSSFLLLQCNIQHHHRIYTHIHLTWRIIIREFPFHVLIYIHSLPKPTQVTTPTVAWKRLVETLPSWRFKVTTFKLGKLIVWNQQKSDTKNPRETTLWSKEFPKGSLNRWDRYHIITQFTIYKWYISGIVPANWGIIWYRTHLLREPETPIDLVN